MLEYISGDTWLALIAFGAACFKHVAGFTKAKISDPTMSYDAAYLSQTIAAGVSAIAVMQGMGTELSIWSAAAAYAAGYGIQSALSR